MREFRLSKLSDERPHVVVVSPHCDDAAFSTAGLVRHCLEHGARVTIVNCFSLSAYAPGLLWRGRQRVTAKRRREDEAFMAFCGGGCTMAWLDFPDAALRAGYRQRDVCSSRPLCAEDLVLTAALAGRLCDYLAHANVVLLPLGLGFHVDHRIARTAGLALAPSRPASFFLYEDLPYASTHSSEALDRWICAFALGEGIRLEPQFVQLPDLIEHKRQAACCYPSQLGGAVATRIVDYVCRFHPSGAERVWRVSHCEDRDELSARLEAEHEGASPSRCYPHEYMVAPDEQTGSMANG